MLQELRIENLLLLERAELRLGPGLNVLTGETGAGKTLLAHALDLLLGGKARSGIVREGAAEAYVEGVFDLPGELAGGADERIPEDASELVLARRVWPDGRTRAYVCGRSATLADLREFGGRLLAFYGQHEHRKLMLASAQLEALDAFCGTPQSERRTAVAVAHTLVLELEAEQAELESRLGARERELDLIEFELSEIEAVDPSEAEEVELTAERDRLRHLQNLRDAADQGAQALMPDEGDGVAVALAQAAAGLASVSEFDSSLGPLAERLDALRYEAEDIGAELHSYLSSLEDSPGRLEFVEERLGAFSRLARKHGGTIGAVLAHADEGRARRAELLAAEETLGDLGERLRVALEDRNRIGDELHAARVDAAPALASGVCERLGELAMGDARFEVVVGEREAGFGPRGRDTVEFLIAPNAGLPIGPLREVASGGELSRVMLALLSVAHGGERASEGDQGLLVFDEIDAGIGGRTARAVGEHLRALSAGRQVLCITHLPQVAALAAGHFTIVKDGSVTPARTTVLAVAGDDLVAELVRMLGADHDDRAAVNHAKELLKAA